MDDLTIARMIHILAIVCWIGGVAFATTVVIPSVKALPPSERLAAFDRIESRFAPQARIWLLFAGASGLWMIQRGGMWDRFGDLHFWWMHAMLCVWSIFFVVLFIIEPVILRRRFEVWAARSPDGAFRLLHRAHILLLGLSLITVIGAVAGSHGFSPF
jgi:uncharacterized membrane protein